MAEVKAGDLNLQSLDTTTKWNRNYEILVRSESASEIMNILLNSTQKERVFYAKEAENILFCNTEVTTGIGEHIGAVASTGTAAAAGGVAASVLGASTVTSTTGGIFGFFATTTTAVVAAPVALVAGAAIGAAALGYGAYKLASKSAEEKGKEKHYKETKQEGRYISNNVRKLNPFVLVNQEFEYIKRSYDYLIALPSLDRQTENEFLSFFDANSTLDNSFDFGADYISMYIDGIKKEFQTKLRNYYEKIKQKYKNGSGSTINKTIALLEINNEYIVPRVKQAENKELIDRIQKGDLIVKNKYQIYEQFLALFNMYKMLLNHPQNTKEQSALQKEKMYARAKELGAVECFEEVLAEKRLIKLDETNYIKYLKEITSVLDDECAREFINTLANDIADCMLVDGVMEPYENEIMHNIARTFSDLLDVNIDIQQYLQKVPEKVLSEQNSTQSWLAKLFGFKK